LVQEAGGAFINFTGSKNSICEGSALVGNAKLVKALQKSIPTSNTKKG
jgi:fructose-1,6-bisphosphatase/inositol monophosphatase family enzyme